MEDPPSAGGRLGAVCSHTGHHVAGHLLHIAEIQQVHAIFNGLCRGGICVHKVIDVHPPYRSAVVCPHDPCPQVSVILFQQKGVQQAPLALEQGSLAGGVDGAPGLDVHLSDAKGPIRPLIVVLQGLRCKVEDAVGGHARPLLQLIVSGQIVGSAVHLRHKSLEISQHALGIQLVTQVKQLFRLGHITQPDRFAVLFHHQPRFLVLQGGVHRVLVTAECRVDLVWNGRLKAAESFLARFSTGSSRNRLETLPSIVSPWESKMHSGCPTGSPERSCVKVSVSLRWFPHKLDIRCFLLSASI